MKPVNVNGMSVPDQCKWVREYGYLIAGIENPCFEVQAAAVMAHAHAIQYIDKPRVNIMLLAVRQDDGHALEHINNPPIEVMIAGVEQSEWAFLYLIDPPKEIRLLHQLLWII